MRLFERFRSLSTYKPHERRVLLRLAFLRNALVGFAAAGVASLPWPLWLVILLVPVVACVVALISADVIEHWLKQRVLGYTYNPNVMARGEFEGSNTIMVASQEAVWRRHMFTFLAIGDDPASGHYDYPHGVPPGQGESE